LSLKIKVDGLSVILTSKPLGRFVSGLTSKSLGQFLLFGIKTDGNGFLVEPQNQGGGGFFGLGLKTGSYTLVILASESPRRFLGLGLKIKHALVCQLWHKIDGRMR
jgi:hypothetical protein